MIEDLTLSNKFKYGWYGVPLILACVFSLFYGFNYGISNHNTYLLHGLRLFNPEILQYDWLASETTTYHPVFSYLVYFFYSIDASGWIFAIANVLVISAGGISLFLIIKKISGRQSSLLIYMMVLGVLSITKSESVSASYMYAGIFQASTVGAVGYLFAILSLLNNRFVLSGFYLAVGGLFHANFLILCFPLFFFVHVFSGNFFLLPRLFKQFFLPLISFVILLPLVLGATSDSLASEGRYIFQTFVAPIHYVPSTYLKEFIPFAAWQTAALSLGWGLFRYSELTKILMLFIVSIGLLVWTATIFTTVIFIPTVSQLYFWRLAPFSDVLCQIVVFYIFIKYLLSNEKFNIKITLIQKILATSSIVLLIVYYTYETKAVILMGLMIVISLAIKRSTSKGKEFTKSLPVIISTIFFILAAIIPIRNVVDNSSLISGFDEPEQSLYDWARLETEPESIFLISPQLYNFRLHSQRAVFVDKKSTPILGAEIVEWYKRMELVSGVDNVKTINDAIDGYNIIDMERIIKINSLYDINYVVTDKKNTRDIKLDVVFVNSKYVVYRLNN